MIRHTTTLFLVICAVTSSGCFLFEEIITPVDEPDQGVVPDMRDMTKGEPRDSAPTLDEGLSGPEDMAPLADLVEEMGDMPPADMSDLIETPPGWWDGQWTARQPITILDTWTDEIVLPVRVHGSLSQQEGHDLRFIFNDQPAPLPHETESWINELDNVVWVRFTQGLDPSDKLEVYAQPRSPVAPNSHHPEEVWRGLARHVYHFDGKNPIIEQDSVEAFQNHMLITNKSNGAGPTYALPNSEMGRRIVFDGDLPSLESQNAPSPLYYEYGRDLTIEVHLVINDFSGTRHYIADENGCVGSRMYYSTRTFGYRQTRGTDCREPSPNVDAQTILDFNPDRSSRIYPNTAYLLFHTNAWQPDERLKMQSFSYAKSAPTDPQNTSSPVYIERYLEDVETRPTTMQVGGWTFQAGPSLFEIDTLIFYDRIISRDERKLRAKAIQSNPEVFERGAIEPIEAQ